MLKEWLNETGSPLNYASIKAYKHITKNKVYQINMSDKSTYLLDYEIELKESGNPEFIELQNVINVDKQEYIGKVIINPKFIISLEEF